MEIKNLNTIENLWCADNGDGTYTNPILYADYSDPDVIKVGDDYYMTASSFNCAPALPILHSKDLVNWKIINHVSLNIPLDHYKEVQHGKGIWAPTLQYHDNKVWLFVCTPDEGLFMSNTEDPAGEWSEMHHVAKFPGWIDPCVFWDEGGQAYLLHAFAKSRLGFCSVLHLCKLTQDAKSIIDDGRFIIDVNGKHHVLEGPRMFKRDGYYYVTAPAGGITNGYQLIFRSKNIYGPYEERTVIHEGDNRINGPRQGTFVKTNSGEDWFIHFHDLDAYGRTVGLQPVHWKDGWPIAGIDIDNDGIGEPVVTYKKPNVGKEYEICIPQTSDDFNSEKLGLQWQWHANPNNAWYSLTERKGFIRLKTVGLPNNSDKLYYAPNLLLQKFASPKFDATTKLSFNPKDDNDKSGLIISGLDYYYIALTKENNNYKISLVKGANADGQISERGERIETILNEVIIENSNESIDIYLTASIKENAICKLGYSLDGQTFEYIGEEFNAVKGRWIGSKVGIFAVNTKIQTSEGYSDFEYFEVR